jgi:hypothetical protein
VPGIRRGFLLTLMFRMAVPVFSPQGPLVLSINFPNRIPHQISDSPAIVCGFQENSLPSDKMFIILEQKRAIVSQVEHP